MLLPKSDRGYDGTAEAAFSTTVYNPRWNVDENQELLDKTVDVLSHLIPPEPGDLRRAPCRYRFHCFSVAANTLAQR